MLSHAKKKPQNKRKENITKTNCVNGFKRMFFVVQVKYEKYIPIIHIQKESGCCII